MSSAMDFGESRETLTADELWLRLLDDRLVGARLRIKGSSVARSHAEAWKRGDITFGKFVEVVLGIGFSQGTSAPPEPENGGT